MSKNIVNYYGAPSLGQNNTLHYPVWQIHTFLGVGSGISSFVIFFIIRNCTKAWKLYHYMLIPTFKYTFKKRMVFTLNSLITNNCTDILKIDAQLALEVIQSRVESCSLCLHDNVMRISHDFHTCFESDDLVLKDTVTHLTLHCDNNSSCFQKRQQFKQ